MSQEDHIGFGSLKYLGSILERLSAKTILLVTGKSSYGKSGAEEHMKRYLWDKQVERLCDFDRNPKIEDLMRALSHCRGVGYNVIVAVGGGSVIDMAKLINFFGASRLDPIAYMEGLCRTAGERIPLVAIPTTAGSGSEATSFAVLYIDRKKHSVSDSCILPDFAIIDADLMMSLPPRLTAVSGMDALGQAIESYWSIHSTTQSKRYAAESIKLVLYNLPTAVNNPSRSSRGAMARAAHLAGKAINITKTTAPHAVSYALTSYFGIPHGHAVALTLSSVLIYNHNVTEQDVLDARGTDYVKQTTMQIAHLLGVEDIGQAKVKIDALMKNTGLETNLGELNIDSSEDIEHIVKYGLDPERVKNNPRRLTRRALRRILYDLVD